MDQQITDPEKMIEAREAANTSNLDRAIDDMLVVVQAMLPGARQALRDGASASGEMASGFEHRRVDLDGKRQRGNRAHARDGDQTLADLAGFMRGVQFGIDS